MLDDSALMPIKLDTYQLYHYSLNILAKNTQPQTWEKSASENMKMNVTPETL